MKKLPLSGSLLTFLDHLEFSEAALAADPETATLAKPFADQIADWPRIFDRERSARRQVVRCEAAVQVEDHQLDRTTVRFGSQLLAECGGDRKSPLFRRYFPSSPSEYVRQPLRSQCEHTLSAIVPELAKLDKKSLLSPFAAPLEKRAKAALSALAARAQAKASRSTCASDIEEWKEDVNRLRLGTYAALLQMASEKGYARAWADDFFLSASTPEKEDPEPTPNGPPPQP